MTIVYVDSNAVGLNDGTSWADAYADLSTAIAGSLLSGDDIYVASNHSVLHSSSVVLSFPSYITVTSVLTSDSSYAKGAKEYATSNGIDISYRGDELSITGVDLPNGRTNSLTLGNALYFNDSTITNVNTAQELMTASNSTIVTFNKCVLTSSDDIVSGGSSRCFVFNFIDSSLSCPSADGILEALTSDSIGQLYFKNCDLSGVLSTGSLFKGAGTYGERVEALFERCIMPPSYTSFVDAGNGGSVIEVIASDTGSGYHYFYKSNQLGIIEENITTYLNATYDGTNGFSTDITSNANASTGAVLRYKLATIPALDLTADKTFKINFTSASALTDADFWLEAVRPDGTSQALGVTQSARSTDILGGSAHTTNAEAWTGGLANTYEQSITITGMVGVTNANVDIFVNLALSSTAVITCPAVVIT